jgi:hypothetical protein
VVLAGYLQHSGERGCVRVYTMPYPIRDLWTVRLRPPKVFAAFSYMLVDEYDPDIFPLSYESLKGGFDGRRVGLSIHYHEILRGLWRGGYML